tara:strand:- start:687 stop:818 length:132 start_codon:yes stop_codon:yes gene_type:complete
MMSKKRKLNSKNPKYNKGLKEKEWSKRKLIREVRGCKIYFCWE